MKDVFIGGVRVLTSDDVADAVFEYSLELSAKGRHSGVNFPGVLDGRITQIRMALGAGVPLIVADADEPLPVLLDGAEFAAWEIRRRAAVSAGRASDMDWGPAD